MQIVQFALFCSFLRTFLSYIFHRTLLSCLLVVYHVYGSSARISADRKALLSPTDSVRLELRSASESIQPVLINLGRPKFEFDSAHVKYGV